MFLRLSLLLVSLLLPCTKTEEHEVHCLQCFTLVLPPGLVHAKCKLFSHPRQTLNCSSYQFSLHKLENVSFLDLSQNNLTRVPTWIFSWSKNMIALNVGENNITEIDSGTFKDSANLQMLNLSFNSLHAWMVDYETELGLLFDLDVTGNKGWLPSRQLTNLKNLHVVRGVAWTQHCGQCVLVRTELVPHPPQDPGAACPPFPFLNSTAGWPWNEQIKYGQALDFIRIGFWPTCLCAPTCFLHQYHIPFIQAESKIFLGAMFCLYATGSVAILLNAAVILFVAFHRQLRSQLSLLLICNIALCDVLTGLFSIVYARFNHPRILTDYMSARLDGSFEKSDADAHFRLRNGMGTILTCAVTSQVWGGFIMTLEKFLKITFVTKPHVRMGKTIASVLVLVSWCLATVFAILPIFNVGRMTYFSVTMATPLPSDIFSAEGSHIKLRMSAAAGTQILLIVVQLASLMLYLPIFLVAKKSGASVGIRREARIAKKIALLVLTNFIIFTIPVVFAVFQDDLWHNVFVEAFPKWQDLTLTNIRWVYFALYTLPALCFSVNSILNPLIYAVRHPKFAQKVASMISANHDQTTRSTRSGRHSDCHTSAL